MMLFALLSPHDQLGNLKGGQPGTAFAGEKEGTPMVGDCEVTTEMTSAPKK